MQHSHSSNSHPVGIPPFVWWPLAGVAGYGALACKALASGHPEPLGSLASIGSLAAGLVGGKLALRALNEGDARRDRRRIDRQREAAANTHGRSRFATAEDIHRFNLSSGKGIFLGSHREGKRKPIDLWYPGENAGLTIGPPASGKAVTSCIPNLLLNPESMIVHDPKFELYAVTADHRRSVMGHDVVLLCPHHETLSHELGIDLPDAGYNPCSIIRDGPTLKDDAELFASVLLPSPGHANPQSEFFALCGQRCVIAANLDLKRKNTPLTLPAINRWLMASAQELNEQLKGMMLSMEMNGLVREIGGKLLTTLLNAPEEFQGGLSMAQNALRIYDSYGPLGRHVSKPGLDPISLKRRPTTVYVGLPTDFGVSHAPYINLTFSTLLESIGRDRSHTRVTVMLDELANIGYMPNLLRSMALYRTQGIRIHGYIQQVSQIRRLYGEEGWRDLVGLCDFVQAFGVTEYETLKLLSEMTGHATVEDVNQTVRPPHWGTLGQAEHSFSHARTGQPLLRPEDIRMLDSGKQLIFYRNAPPILADKVDYRSRPELLRVAKPNPYYERAKRASTPPAGGAQ
jgi:type IV secretion system protein VirD4